jgi:DNA-binding NarL/FixJ family response regulator
MSTDNESLKILIADDHALVRGGLALLLQMLDSDVEIPQANTYEEIIELLSKNPDTDLVLVDLLMPGMEEFEGVRGIRKFAPDIPVIVVSVRETSKDIQDALDAGAVGYIPKTSTPEVTLGAIRLVLSGGLYLPPHILRRTAIDAGRALPLRAERLEAESGLTPRQYEVLALIAQGKSNRDIAAILGVSLGTVKVHVLRIFRELNVQNRTEAVMKATEIGTLPAMKRGLT